MSKTTDRLLQICRYSNINLIKVKGFTELHTQVKYNILFIYLQILTNEIQQSAHSVQILCYYILLSTYRKTNGIEKRNHKIYTKHCKNK